MNDVEQLIERYLSNKMTEPEVKEFQNRLQSKAKFASEYEKTIAAHQLITEAGRLNLKQKLEDFDADTKPEIAASKVLPLWIKPVLRIAAVFLVSFGIYQFVFNQSVTTNDIYNDYFVVYNSPSAIRDSETKTKINWQNASQLYQDKKYSEAIAFFIKAESETPNYQVSFYKAMSYVSQYKPNFDKALQNFETVLKTDNDYQQQALWYKALILLKLNDKENAFKIFKSIVKSKSYNFKKAEEILDLKIKQQI
jgi:tetratricopeptide (TPR) repeat protein